MRKLTSLSIAILSMFASLQFASSANVVLNVTVPNQTYEVWVVGSFNNWNNNLTKCTKVDANHYTITLDEATFVSGVTKNNMEYKYLCGGGDWVYIEKDALGAEIQNRKYADSNGNDIVQGWIIWYPPMPLLPMNVTIHTKTPIGTKECYIVGNFNGWAGPLAPIDSCKMKKTSTNPDGTIVFEKTIYSPDVNKLMYRFCSGPDWSYEQKSPVGDFVYPEVNPVVTEWKAIYNPANVGAIKINATVPTGTHNVWIMGSFLGWDMSKAVEGTKNTNGTYSFTIPNVISIEYKLYNQLDWAHGEIDPATGQDRANRMASYPADSVTNITVLKWNEIIDSIAPTVPGDLKITPLTATTYYLSWQRSLDNTAIVGYEVYKDGILYGITSNLGLNISGLTACETQITVKAKDIAGNLSVSSVPLIVGSVKVSAGADQIITSGGTAWLSSDATVYAGVGTLKYKWTPSTGLNNDTLANPTTTLTKEIVYILTVTTPAGCTKSDTVAIRISLMEKPEIGIVGISSTNKNRIVWNKPVSTGIASYYIYRETNVSNVYVKIGSTSYDSLSVFVDEQSLPAVKSNKYRMSIFDRSGFESAQSNAHKTMHLSINKGQNSTWNLIWEPYEGFAVSTYNIYRGTSANNINFIDAVSGSSTQYSDISAPTGDVYYQLEVISPTLISPTKAPFAAQKSNESESTIASALVSYSSSRSNIASNVINGTHELEGENKNIKLYPNPVKNELRINFEGGTTFDVLNLMGQIVSTGNLNENNILNTSNYLSGVYLMRIKVGNTFEYKKFVKE